MVVAQEEVVHQFGSPVNLGRDQVGLDRHSPGRLLEHRLQTQVHVDVMLPVFGDPLLRQAGMKEADQLP